MLEGILHHECLSFLVLPVEFIAGDVAEETEMVLAHVLTIVRKG